MTPSEEQKEAFMNGLMTGQMMSALYDEECGMTEDRMIRWMNIVFLKKGEYSHEYKKFPPEKRRIIDAALKKIGENNESDG